MIIKALETTYKGHRFRSRLEARWAVFLDEMGARWEYEKEGYDMDGVCYLPDFWLPDVLDRSKQKGIWLEIKGRTPHKPCSPEECGAECGAWFDTPMAWHYCSRCRTSKITFPNNYYNCPLCGKDSCCDTDARIERALEAARSARFR